MELALGCQRATLVIRSDVVERGIDLPIVGITRCVYVRERIVARSVSEVADGCFNKNASSYLVLVNSRSENERGGKGHAVVRMIKYSSDCKHESQCMPTQM